MSHDSGSAQFVRAARSSFAYLVSDFGFDEDQDSGVDVGVSWSSSTARVRVEGRDWGLNARVAIGRPSGSFDNFDLEDLMHIRKMEFSDRPPRGSVEGGSHQLDQVRFYARALVAAARDFLAGDVSVLGQLESLVAERAARFERK